MSDLLLHLELSATDVWATFRGDNSSLSVIERLLQEKLAEAGGKLARGVQPWFRDVGYLKVLAGLVPWVWPEREYPRAWGQSPKVLGAALQQLLSWGWRDYQVEAIRDAALAPLGRATIEVGTGGGKTRIAWGLAFVCGGAWRYVVYGKDIVRQAGEAFAELSSKFAPVNLRAYSWRKLPLDGMGLIADECHQVAAKSRARRLGAGRWLWRVGASGTPLDRMDAKNALTIGFFGPRVAHIGVEQLTDEGHLTPGVVRMIRGL